MVYALLAILLAFSLLPIYWLLATSFKTRFDIFANPGQFFPFPFTLHAYQQVLSDPHFLTYFKNSLIVNLATSLITVALALLAGYSFSRFRFRGNQALLLFILATQMFPSAVLLLSLYILFRQLHLLNTYPALIISYVTFGLPFSIWMMKGFADGVPEEIEQAAMIDGCSRMQALLRVVVPMLVPGMIAVALFSFLAGWNDLMWSLTLTSSTSMRLIPPGFILTYVGQFQTYWNQLMAGSVLVSIPTVAVFTLLQRYLVQGLTSGGVKG
jgi:multiple sugar transport system permease protein